MSDMEIHNLRLAIYEEMRHREGKAHQDFWAEKRRWAQENFVSALENQAKS